MAAKQMVAEIHAEVPDSAAVVPVTPNGDVSVGGLLQLAVTQLGGSNPDAVVNAMERLVALHERMETRAAEKAFNKAMNDFQAECPQILKTSQASIRTKSGGSYGYKYAELDQIDDAIRPLMTRLGLSKRFTTERIGGDVKVTCIVSHVDGHSISADFQCAIDSDAAMSGAQKGGAAVTFAKRYALIAALGLTTTESDTDAQLGVDRSPAKISQGQAADIEALITEVGAVRSKFLGYFDVEDVSDLTVSQLPKAVQMLEAKRKKVA